MCYVYSHNTVISIVHINQSKQYAFGTCLDDVRSICVYSCDCHIIFTQVYVLCCLADVVIMLCGVVIPMDVTTKSTFCPVLTGMS